MCNVLVRHSRYKLVVFIDRQSVQQADCVSAANPLHIDEQQGESSLWHFQLSCHCPYSASMALFSQPSHCKKKELIQPTSVYV